MVWHVWQVWCGTCGKCNQCQQAQQARQAQQASKHGKSRQHHHAAHHADDGVGGSRDDTLALEARPADARACSTAGPQHHTITRREEAAVRLWALRQQVLQPLKATGATAALLQPPISEGAPLGTHRGQQP